MIIPRTADTLFAAKERNIAILYEGLIRRYTKNISDKKTKTSMIMKLCK